MKKEHVLWHVQIPKAGIEYTLFIKATHDPKEALAQVLCTLDNIVSFFKERDLPSLDNAIARADGSSIYDASRSIFAMKTKIEMR